VQGNWRLGPRLLGYYAIEINLDSQAVGLCIRKNTARFIELIKGTRNDTFETANCYSSAKSDCTSLISCPPYLPESTAVPVSVTYRYVIGYY
jgi:hypothetical protein